MEFPLQISQKDGKMDLFSKRILMPWRKGATFTAFLCPCKKGTGFSPEFSPRILCIVFLVNAPGRLRNYMLQNLKEVLISL